MVIEGFGVRSPVVAFIWGRNGGPVTSHSTSVIV